MPPKGRSYQKGFVRGIGMTPSKRDRQNRRQKTVPVVQVVPLAKSENRTKLELLREEYPLLYQEVVRFAQKFDKKGEAWFAFVVNHIEQALAEQKAQRHYEELLQRYLGERV